MLLEFVLVFLASFQANEIQRIKSLAEDKQWDAARVLVKEVFANASVTKKHLDLYQVGMTWIREFEFDGATWMFERFLEAYPNMPSAHSDYAVTLRTAGRYAEAEKVFRAAIEKFPREGALMNNLGLLLQAQRRDDEAKKLFWESRQLGNADAESNVAALERLRGNFAKSREALTETLQQDNPDHAKRWARQLFGLLRLQGKR